MHLRNRRVQKSDARQIVRKCPSPVIPTFKALLANTAGEAFSLGIVMFSSLAECVTHSSIMCVSTLSPQ